MSEISGFEAYSLYTSLKLHFSTENYNFFLYNGKIKTNKDSFENRKDKYYFYKLSRRLKNREEFILFLVSNFIENDNCWVGNLLDESSEITFRERQKILQGLTYFFENDCKTIFENANNPNDILVVKTGDYPPLLKFSLQKTIHLETFCILNSIINFIPSWDKKITDTIRWPEYRKKALKYIPFINFDKEKMKLVLKKVLNK